MSEKKDILDILRNWWLTAIFCIVDDANEIF
jgi:hypothetical protein